METKSVYFNILQSADTTFCTLATSIGFQKTQILATSVLASGGFVVGRVLGKIPSNITSTQVIIRLVMAIVGVSLFGGGRYMFHKSFSLFPTEEKKRVDNRLWFELVGATAVGVGLLDLSDCMNFLSDCMDFWV
jgi:hypothetical protein